MSAGLGDIKFTNASMRVCREWGFAKRKDLSVRRLICKISTYIYVLACCYCGYLFYFSSHETSAFQTNSLLLNLNNNNQRPQIFPIGVMRWEQLAVA